MIIKLERHHRGAMCSIAGQFSVNSNLGERPEFREQPATLRRDNRMCSGVSSLCLRDYGLNCMSNVCGCLVLILQECISTRCAPEILCAPLAFHPLHLISRNQNTFIIERGAEGGFQCLLRGAYFTATTRVY